MFGVRLLRGNLKNLNQGLPLPLIISRDLPRTFSLAFSNQSNSHNESAKKYEQRLKGPGTTNAELLIDGDFIRISINRKPAKTPKKRVLEFPLKNKLISLVVFEEIKALKFPIHRDLICATSLIYKSIDSLDDPQERAETISKILEYGRTDSVCYFKSYPASLSDLQDEKWTPLVKLAENRFCSDIKIFRDILKDSIQPRDLLRKYGIYLETLDPFKLAAFELASIETKSFIIPFALLELGIPLGDAVEAAYLEFKYQADKWGEVKGGDYHVNLS